MTGEPDPTPELPPFPAVFASTPYHRWADEPGAVAAGPGFPVTVVPPQEPPY